MTPRLRRPRLVLALVATVGLLASLLLATPARAADGTHIVGLVTDASGDPIADADVYVGTSESSGGFGVKTDSLGRYDSDDSPYLQDLTTREYWVSVSAPWAIGTPVHASTGGPVDVIAGEKATKDFVLERRRTATFTVVAPDGDPVAHAPVGISVFRDGAWGPIQSGPHCTDDQGRYRFVQGVGSAYKAFFSPTPDEDCDLQSGTPSDPDLVGEYWNDAYADEDATVIDFADAAYDVQHTVTLGPAPTIKHGTIGVAGTPKVGQTLTATTTEWSPSNVRLGYQWTSNGADIPGATHSELVLTEQLQGKYLGLRVIGRLPGEKSVDQTAWVGEPVAAGTAPATVSAATPTISGTAQAGRTLTARPGPWGPAGISLTYQWFADGQALTGATASTYALTNNRAGQRISVRVTGTLSPSRVASRTSAQSKAVVGVLTVRRPTVKGTARKGRKLTASVSAWSPRPVTLTYRWLRNGTAISGATSKTYTLRSADVGKRITVRVTGRKASYTTRTSTSARTATVKR